MKDYIFRCCPRCGNIGGSCSDSASMDKIVQCPQCKSAIMIAIQSNISNDDFCGMAKEQIKAYCSSLREQYTLHSKEFDQQAWDKRVLEDEKPLYIPPTYGKPVPKCICCGSTNLKKISTASKVGKVALWGIFAAGKVAKTWHCNDCGTEW